MRSAGLRRTVKALAVFAVTIVFMGGRATAQISSPSESTAGASCSGGGGGDGDCRNSVSFSTPSNGITFTSRYAWNINADTGVFSTHDTSGNAQHNISFSVTAPGAYFLTIDSRRTGDLNRISDASGCDGSADTSVTTGSQTGGTLTSGTLSLTDPGSIGNGGSDAEVPFNQSATGQINGTSNGVTKAHTLTFTWNGSVRSNSCEAAVRQGESSGTTSGCTACGYPGSPSRTQSGDGHFVTVTLHYCGDGVTDSSLGETCDQGSSNGDPDSCCDANCHLISAGTVCRASGGACDPQEVCDGPNEILKFFLGRTGRRH